MKTISQHLISKFAFLKCSKFSSIFTMNSFHSYGWQTWLGIRTGSSESTLSGDGTYLFWFLKRWNSNAQVSKKIGAGKQQNGSKSPIHFCLNDLLGHLANHWFIRNQEDSPRRNIGRKVQPWGKETNKELTHSTNPISFSKTVLYGSLPRSTQQQLLVIINVWQIRESP